MSLNGPRGRGTIWRLPSGIELPLPERVHSPLYDSKPPYAQNDESFYQAGKGSWSKGFLIQDNGEDTVTQRRMLFVLSVIAELLRQNSKFYYPFTRKFLLTVFSIDAELLQCSPIKDNILAILSVIYENLSRQPKLVAKYSIQKELKQAVLGSYQLITEVYTLKVMDKAISNMINKGITISNEDFEKFKVL